MTSLRPDFTEPRIEIHHSAGGIDIRQQRPAITRALAGLPPAVALQRIPTLLPICGGAQAAAAALALAAARGEPEEAVAGSSASQWREQALACGWRLCVDWPDLLGEPRQMTALKQLHQSPDEKTCATALGGMVSGLEAVHTLDGLLGWVKASDCLAAAVIRRTEQQAGSWARTRSSVSLEAAGLRPRACSALAAEPFDPGDPADSPLEVGPLAMARDPLTEELCETMGSSVVSRLLAQLLDARFLVGVMLDREGEQQPAGRGPGAWSCTRSDVARSGIGCVVTSRGPVFHQVRLVAAEDTGGDSVADWRVLAPTDWHFGRRGPVALELAKLEVPTREQVALVVASYDPCAPWTLHRAEEVEQHA